MKSYYKFIQSKGMEKDSSLPCARASVPFTTSQKENDETKLCLVLACTRYNEWKIKSHSGLKNYMYQ